MNAEITSEFVRFPGMLRLLEIRDYLLEIREDKGLKKRWYAQSYPWDCICGTDRRRAELGEGGSRFCPGPFAVTVLLGAPGRLSDLSVIPAASLTPNIASSPGSRAAAGKRKWLHTT